MKITPLADNILVKVDKGETVTASGIVVSTTKQKYEGDVISIGKDVTEVKVGDYVGYPPQSFPSFKKEGNLYLVIPESNISYKHG